MSSETDETSPLMQLAFLNPVLRVCELVDVPEGMTVQIVGHYLQSQLRWEWERLIWAFDRLEELVEKRTMQTSHQKELQPRALMLALN